MALKVLTVDDSKTIRMIVKKAFRPYNCEVVEAENGSKGWPPRSRKNLTSLSSTSPCRS